jgi:hypothetical protein
MRIAITGATGLVGANLTKYLQGGGHEVLRLTRHAAGGQARDVLWSVERGLVNPEQLESCDAVVHLAGENIADGRWTEAKKERIRSSRVEGTASLCQSLAGLKAPPKVVVSASAIGFYGNRGEEVLTEESGPGAGFFPEVCQAWERATQAVEDKGIRVVHLRIGVVLCEDGGALAKMLVPFKFGLGGRIGSGEQYMSWVALDDLLGAIDFCLKNETMRGPVNATAPNPVTNADFTRLLGEALHRPTLFPVPAFALRLALGEMADEALLAGARVMPTRLLAAGFEFRFGALAKALRHAIQD